MIQPRFLFFPNWKSSSFFSYRSLSQFVMDLSSGQRAFICESSWNHGATINTNMIVCLYHGWPLQTLFESLSTLIFLNHKENYLIIFSTVETLTFAVLNRLVIHKSPSWWSFFTQQCSTNSNEKGRLLDHFFLKCMRNSKGTLSDTLACFTWVSHAIWICGSELFDSV